MNQKLKSLLISRKFWALIVGLVLIITKAFRPDFPLTEDQLIPIVAILASFILGTAVEDAGKSISQASANQSDVLAAQRETLSVQKDALIAIASQRNPPAPPTFRSGPGA